MARRGCKPRAGKGKWKGGDDMTVCRLEDLGGRWQGVTVKGVSGESGRNRVHEPVSNVVQGTFNGIKECYGILSHTAQLNARSRI
jgi:hypothetical protein